jgi:hypothetical protein
LAEGLAAGLADSLDDGLAAGLLEAASLLFEPPQALNDKTNNEVKARPATLDFQDFIFLLPLLWCA